MLTAEEILEQHKSNRIHSEGVKKTVKKLVNDYDEVVNSGLGDFEIEYISDISDEVHIVTEFDENLTVKWNEAVEDIVISR